MITGFDIINAYYLSGPERKRKRKSKDYHTKLHRFIFVFYMLFS